MTSLCCQSTTCSTPTSTDVIATLHRLLASYSRRNRDLFPSCHNRNAAAAAAAVACSPSSYSTTYERNRDHILCYLPMGPRSEYLANSHSSITHSDSSLHPPHICNHYFQVWSATYFADHKRQFSFFVSSSSWIRYLLYFKSCSQFLCFIQQWPFDLNWCSCFSNLSNTGWNKNIHKKWSWM